MSYEPLSQEGSRDHKQWNDDTQQLENPYGTVSYDVADEYADRLSVSSTSQLGHRGSEPSLLSKPSSRPVSGEAWRRLSGAPAWEHKLSEKHLERAPSASKTVRYFDPSRQTRRVFLDCLWMWLGTALICAGIAAVLLFFQSIKGGLSKWQKYVFNTLINGLLLILGIAFAAQFKQYCEMMRWRFLASSYRSLDEFDEVMGCDSWRSAIRLIYKRSKKSWYPNKSQVLAVAWVLIFSAFNVLAAFLGLTYGLDPSDTVRHLSPGQVSVLDLRNVTVSEANYWGQVGSRFASTSRDLRADDHSADNSTVYQSWAGDYWWYRFQDQDRNHTIQRSSSRTIASKATCKERQLDAPPPPNIQNPCDNSTDLQIPLYGDGQAYCLQIANAVDGLTTWMSTDDLSCGPSCSVVLAYQSVTTVPDVGPNVTKPRLWSCNSTLEGVNVARTRDYKDGGNPLLQIPSDQVNTFAGAIGRTDIEEFENATFEYSRVLGNFQSIYNPTDNATNSSIACLIMKFTVGTLAAIDRAHEAPYRTNIDGLEPSIALIVNIQWWRAGPILIGLPAIQLLMLVGVVWFSGKAIILEPSYLTAAHLLYPVMQKLGHQGILMTADEMSEMLGPDFKIAYAVRPNPNEPGHWNKEVVRDLDLVEESEGFGYIRGRMPEGRYD